MPQDNQLISEQLARFVVWTKFEDIPPELVLKAQRHILDSVGQHGESTPQDIPQGRFPAHWRQKTDTTILKIHMR